MRRTSAAAAATSSSSVWFPRIRRPAHTPEQPPQHIIHTQRDSTLTPSSSPQACEAAREEEAWAGVRRLGAAALRTGGGAEDVDLHVITRRLEEGKLVRSEDRAMNRHAAGPRGARRWLPPERARGDAHAAELRLDGARGADGDGGGGGRGHGFGHHVSRDR